MAGDFERFPVNNANNGEQLNYYNYGNKRNY